MMYVLPPAGPVSTGDVSVQSAPEGGEAIRADPDARRRLVTALNEPLHTFEPDEARALLILLSRAFEALRHWGPLPTLVWCEGGERLGAGRMDRTPYLLVTQGGTEWQPELHAALVHDLYPGQASLPAHLPPGNKFATPPLDVFDVVEAMVCWHPPQGLEQRLSLATERGTLRAGMPWRYALAQYLDTLEGRRLDVSACLRPAAAVRPADPVSVSVPAAAPVSALAAALTSASATASASASVATPLPAPARPIVPLGRAVPGPMKLDGLAECHALRVNALIDLVRTGGWLEVLDRVAPQLMMRLPEDHPLQMGRLQLLLGNGQRLTLWPHHPTTRQAHIRFDPGSDRVDVRYLPGKNRTAIFTGPDSHLEALIPNPCGAPEWSVEQTRALLAELIQRAPVMTALCLEIFRRWPDCHPETMLRFCLHGKSLQQAGRQLLDPAAPQRDVTALDVMRWQDCRQGVGNSPNDIEAQGVSLAHARWHFGPLGATRAGQQLMFEAGLICRPPDEMEEQFRQAQFQSQLPQLLHEFNSWPLLAEFMARNHITLQNMLTPEAHEQVRRMAWRIKAESLLTGAWYGRAEGLPRAAAATSTFTSTPAFAASNPRHSVDAPPPFPGNAQGQ